MKKIGLLFFCLSVLLLGYSIVPQSFKYQAILRDNSGIVIANRNVGIRLSILKTTASGTSVYTETQAVTTTNLGLINIEIGKGTPVSGSMQNIDWSNDNYFIKIEMDDNGGSSYSLVGTSQLVSVPYALFAGKASNGTQWKDTATSIYYNAGRVGVGTNAPKSDFEVRGNTGCRLTITGNIPSIRLSDTAYSGNGVTIGVAADSNNLIPRSGKGDLVFTNEAFGTGGGYIFGTGVPSQACVKITNDCKVGIGTDAPVSKLDVRGGDVNIGDIGSGVIMKSPDGNCWRMTVSNTGLPVFTSINCLTGLVVNNQSNSWGAVASYPFNGNANDISGNNFNGVVHNTTLATDKNGTPNSCYYFRGYQNGNPDYITLPTLGAINNSEEISVSLWVKVDSTIQSGGTPFTMMPDDASDRFNTHINYLPFQVVWDNGDIFGNGRVFLYRSNSFTWDHYVFVKSAINNKMQVYLNNALIIDGNKHDDISNKNKNIRLGGGAGNTEYFAGWMDNVKIFNRALTATEVSSIYNAER